MGSGHSIVAAQGGAVTNQYLAELGEGREAVRLGDEMVEFMRQRGDQVGEWTGEKEDLWFGKKEERVAMSAEQYRLHEIKEKKRKAREARANKAKAAEEQAAREAEAEAIAAAQAARGASSSRPPGWYENELKALAGNGQNVEWRRNIARARANAALYLMAGRAISQKWDDMANYINGLPAMMDAILGTSRNRDLFLGWALKAKRTEEAMRSEVRAKAEAAQAALEELQKDAEHARERAEAEAHNSVQGEAGDEGPGEMGTTEKYQKENEQMIQVLETELKEKRRLAKEMSEALSVLEEMAANDAKASSLNTQELMAMVNSGDADLDVELKGTIYQMNRANHASMRRLRYDLPPVHSLETLGSSKGFGEERTKHMSTMVAKEKLLEMFTEGKVAFQLIACADKWHCGKGEMLDMYLLDPWDVVKLFYTNDAEHDLEGIVRGGRIDGLSFGPRLVLQLIAAVTAYAGEEAAAKLAIVIHCAPSCEQFVVADLVEREFYGLARQNCLVLVQPALSGYTVDEESNGFVESHTHKPRTFGSGFAMRQLMWPSQAFMLDAAVPSRMEEESRPKSRSKKKDLKTKKVQPRFLKKIIREDVITYLQAEGFELLTSLRTTDLSRYMGRNALDIDFLTWFVKLQYECDARVGVDAQKVDGVKGVRTHGSLVMRKHSTRHPSFEVTGFLSPELSEAEAAGKRAGEVVEAQGMGVGYAKAQKEVVEVATQDEVFPEDDPFVAVIKNDHMNHLSAHRMLQHLEKVSRDGSMWSATDRFVFALKDLRTVLTGEGSSNPVLSMHGHGFYASTHMADITLGKESRCVAIKGNSPHVKLSSKTLDHEGVQELTAILQKQDADPAFKEMAGTYQSRARPATLKVNGREPRHRVLFLALGDPTACDKALKYVGRMLIPGVDEMHVVALAASRNKVPEALRTVSALELEDCFVSVQREAIVQSDYDNEADALAAYADIVDATLVVIPTRGASFKDAKFARLRDLSFLKALYTRPVFLVKDDHWIPADYEEVTETIVRSSLKSKGLVEYLCNLLRRRFDMIVLAVHETDHAGDISLREKLVDSLADKCAQSGIQAQAHFMQGANYNRAISTTAAKMHAEVVTIITMKSQRVEDDFTSFLESQTAHVLVWRYQKV